MLPEEQRNMTAPHQNLLGMSGKAVDTGEETDPNFNQTVLLVHADGTNGGQNNTFLDSSTNNLSITRIGTPTQGTFNPFLGEGQYSRYSKTGSSRDQHGSGVTLGTNNFTIGMFVYPIGRSDTIGATLNTGGNSRTTLYADTGGETVILAHNQFLTGFTGSAWGVEINFTTAIALNQWQWIQIDRTGNTFRVSIDGSYVDGGGVTNSSSIPEITAGTFGQRSGQDVFLGYYNNFIIINGANRGSITPPTTSLTANSYTAILLHQSNRFVNNGNTSVTLTSGGDNKIVPFSPLAPTASYSESVHGGSGFFGDGTNTSGDYIHATLPSAIGTGDMTVEFWWYPTAFYDFVAPFSVNEPGTRANGFNIGSDANATLKMVDIDASNFQSSNNTLTKFEWQHIAMVRSGSTIRMFRNGVQVGTISNSSNWTGTRVAIATRADDVGTETASGYIANCNLVVGTAKYGSSGYTIPTSPITAHSNTKFLANFTNASIIDHSMKNNLETIGHAQIDTSIKKFGTGSVEFDGTGDTVVSPAYHSSVFDIGNGLFTIEFFVYRRGTGQQTIVMLGTGDGNSVGLNFFWSGALQIYNGGSALDADAGSLAQNQWVYVVLQRDASNISVYVDGTRTENFANTTTWSALNRVSLGKHLNGTNELDGLLDEVRITRGIARYSGTSMTVPTKAHPNR